MFVNEKLHQPLYPMTLSVSQHIPEDIKIQGDLENFYNTSLTALPKISEKMQAKLMRLMGSAYRDALFHLPVGAVNRQIVPVIDPEQHLSEVISFECIVKKHLFRKEREHPTGLLFLWKQCKDLRSFIWSILEALVIWCVIYCLLDHSALSPVN